MDTCKLLTEKQLMTQVDKILNNCQQLDKYAKNHITYEQVLLKENWVSENPAIAISMLCHLEKQITKVIPPGNAWMTLTGFVYKNKKYAETVDKFLKNRSREIQVIMADESSMG